MELGEKLRHLRDVEGGMRGLGRSLTKAEVARAMRAELGAGLSAPYLSQLENGQRQHLTAPTRALLARFYKVHPGYLVGDPEGYEMTTRVAALSRKFDLPGWLADRAEELRDDPLLYHLFLRLARSDDPRRDLLVLDALLDQDAALLGAPAAVGAVGPGRGVQGVQSVRGRMTLQPEGEQLRDLLLAAISAEHELFQAATAARTAALRWDERAALAQRKEALDLAAAARERAAACWARARAFAAEYIRQKTNVAQLKATLDPSARGESGASGGPPARRVAGIDAQASRRSVAAVESDLAELKRRYGRN